MTQNSSITLTEHHRESLDSHQSCYPFLCDSHLPIGQTRHFLSGIHEYFAQVDYGIVPGLRHVDLEHLEESILMNFHDLFDFAAENQLVCHHPLGYDRGSLLDYRCDVCVAVEDFCYDSHDSAF